MFYPLPTNERRRLDALDSFNILDTDVEREFDDLTRLAARISETPISFISLIDADRRWFKSKIGLDTCESAREASFGAHVAAAADVFVVQNAAEDVRFAKNPMVTGEPHIRFYAGAPLLTAEGGALGALCVIDTVPRLLNDAQKECLRALARQTVSLIKTRRESALLLLANRELESSRENYRIVSESASDAIITINGESEIIFANKAVEKIFGYAAPELIGKRLSVIVPERTRDGQPGGMPRYMEAGRENIARSGIVLPAIRRDGREIEIEMSFGEYRQDDKRLFTAVIRDITERRQTEEKLRESERQYRFATEAVPQHVWTAKPNGELDYGNRRAAVYFGTNDGSELLGKSWLSSLHADDTARTIERWTHSVATGEPYETEFRLRRGDGDYRWHLSKAVAMRDESGAITKWFGTNTDIHDRKIAEQAAREAGEYRHLFQNANDAILIFEPENRIVVDVNEKACRMYGIERADFLGTNLRQLVRDDEFQPRGLPEPGTQQSFETVHYHADGTPIHLLINSSVVDYQGRRVVLSINHNITERKRSEAALVESEERLRQSQKMEAIGTLTGGVAHDFNNLLTAIIGNTQLALLKAEPDSRIYNRLTEIEHAGNRAAALTRRLLAFSRRQLLERRNINLTDTISEIVKLLKRIIGEDIEVCVRYGSGAATVFADAAQIEQIVMNLAVNARDAMPDGGTLTIETGGVALDADYCRRYPYAKPGKYALVKITDTGTGIDRETQTRIFEPYFTTKEVGKGTGLGLSMVYGIVKQHDGHINLDSRPGEGTTFSVFLPAVEQPVDEEKQSAQISITGGDEIILVAEDEEPLQMLAKDFLESLGYTVLLATNGEEAVEVFVANRARIDLLLFDVVMPRMSGAEAYRRICELKGCDVPLIFMTGYSPEIVRSRFDKLSGAPEIAAAVIQKPYAIKSLGLKIRQVLDNR